MEKLDRHVTVEVTGDVYQSGSVSVFARPSGNRVLQVDSEGSRSTSKTARSRRTSESYPTADTASLSTTTSISTDARISRSWTVKRVLRRPVVSGVLTERQWFSEPSLQRSDARKLRHVPGGSCTEAHSDHVEDAREPPLPIERCVSTRVVAITLDRILGTVGTDSAKAADLAQLGSLFEPPASSLRRQRLKTRARCRNAFSACVRSTEITMIQLSHGTSGDWFWGS